MTQEYQVALSFSGKQRKYAKEVFEHLKKENISVFYDKNEMIWGDFLPDKLANVFRNDSKYVVMFMSKDYLKEGGWSKYEYEQILSEQATSYENRALIYRCDDSKIPTPFSSFAYLEGLTSYELSKKILNKLGVKHLTRKDSEIPPPSQEDKKDTAIFDYSNHNGRYKIGAGDYEFETHWSKAGSESIHTYNDPASIKGLAIAYNITKITDITDASIFDFSSRVRTPRINEIVIIKNINDFYAALQIKSIKVRSRGDDHDELTFEYVIQTDGSKDFSNCR